MQILLVELSLLLITTAASLAGKVTIQVRHGDCPDGCCGTNDWTCSSLVAALERVRPIGNISQEIHILLYNSQPPQPYILSPDVADFVGMMNFTLQGFDGLVDICCRSGAGLSFIYSTNITFKNVRFLGCGVLRNSTSRDLSVQHQNSFLTFRSSLFFLFCADVTMLNVDVSQSNGTGVVLYSTVGKNTFTDSKFVDNAASSYPQGGGGGMTVEFVFCIPGDLSCFEKNSLQVQTSTHLMLHTVLATVVFYRTEPLQPITAQQHLHLLSKVTTLLWADPFSSWLVSS